MQAGDVTNGNVDTIPAKTGDNVVVSCSNGYNLITEASKSKAICNDDWKNPPTCDGE